MTKGGWTFAGIFSIIGGGILCLVDLLLLLLLSSSGSPVDQGLLIYMIILLAIVTLGVVGGILVLLDKKIGSIMALITGIVGFVLVIAFFVYATSKFTIPPQFQGLFTFLFFLAPSMILTAGIVGLLVGTEK